MIQDIKDRVPVNVLSNDAIRYGIYDEQGNLLRYEYIKREDEPTEIGTPVNRKLFSNIQGDLYTADRYNIPTTTIDYIPATDKTDIVLRETLIQGDCIPKDWTFSNYSGSSLIATSTSGNIKLYYNNQSGYVGETVNGIKIFDGNESTFENVRVYSESVKAIIEFDRYVKIKKFKLKIQASNYATTFDIVGSDDNKTYTVLYPKIATQGSTGTLTEYEIRSPKYFKYFGIKVSGGTTANSLSIYELQVSEYYDDVVFGKKTSFNKLNLPLTSYEVGKTINLKGNSCIDPQPVERTGNVFSKTWNKVSDTEYVSDDGTVLSSSSIDPNYILTNAVDGSTDTNWTSEWVKTSPTSWVKVKLPKPLKILGMEIYVTAGGKKFSKAVIQGSNDDEKWDDLYTITTAQSSLTAITLENTDFYEYYRVLITTTLNGSSYETGIIFDWQVTKYIEIDELSETNTFENPYLDINNLGKKQIMGTIIKNKYYNLVYDGSVWLSQVTNIGVGSEPIVITESGTYEVDPDIRYKVIAVGGGGGAIHFYASYYSEYSGATGGGAGGIIEDFENFPTGSVDVVIGAIGGHHTISSNYGGGQGSATDGGDTIIGRFTAHGGKGAYSKIIDGSSGANEITVGEGGSFSGGAGRKGEDGSIRTANSWYYGYGGKGFKYNGVSYGSGGSVTCYYKNIDNLTLTSATQGIVILYPMV